MTAPRFFYLVTADSRHRMPDESFADHLGRRLFRRHKRVPTGGVKVIYQHCGFLNDAGIAAYPVHLGKFTVDWMDHSLTPLREAEALAMATPDDILVVPERLPRAGTRFPCRHRVAFVQNGGLVDKALGTSRFEDFGFTDILCCSNWLADFMAARTGLPRHVAVNGIDLDRFRPAPERRIANRVLYLQRKATWRHGPAAIARLPAELRASVEVVALENRMTEAEMIAAYQAADIFLALGYPEGFALPPLEAMASGTAIVGFTGGGGAEHMIEGETALVVPDGDDIALANALGRMLHDLPLREKLRRGGYEMSRRFGMDRMQAAVLSFAEDILSSGNGPAS